MREARDRLTSSTGIQPAFDHELLRQYAQNRISASLIILLLVATVGFMSSIWSGAFAAGTWTAAVLVIHVVMIAKCRQFLERPMQEISPSAWRVRFVTLDLFYGLAWMFILIRIVGAEESSSIFILFVMTDGCGGIEHACIESADSSVRRHFPCHHYSRSGLHLARNIRPTSTTPASICSV